MGIEAFVTQHEPIIRMLASPFTGKVTGYAINRRQWAQGDG